MFYPDLLSRPLPPPPNLVVHGGEPDPLPDHNLYPAQVQGYHTLAFDWSISSILASDWSIPHRYSVSTSVARLARQGQMALMKKQDFMDEFVRWLMLLFSKLFCLIDSFYSFSISSCSLLWVYCGSLTVFTSCSTGITRSWMTAWPRWSWCSEFSDVSTFPEDSLYSWSLFVKGQHYRRFVDTDTFLHITFTFMFNGINVLLATTFL